MHEKGSNNLTVITESRKPITPTYLCELGAKHGTDKSPIFDGKQHKRAWMTGHNYTPFYSKLFSTSIHHLLEIGIDQGNSLKMWEEFFPDADIYGVDVTDCRVYFGDRITTI